MHYCFPTHHLSSARPPHMQWRHSEHNHSISGSVTIYTSPKRRREREGTGVCKKIADPLSQWDLQKYCTLTSTPSKSPERPSGGGLLLICNLVTDWCKFSCKIHNRNKNKTTVLEKPSLLYSSFKRWFGIILSQIHLVRNKTDLHATKLHNCTF